MGGEGKERGLAGFSDADGASQGHRDAITSFAFLVDGGAVSWSSKKQKLVTLSTTEASMSRPSKRHVTPRGCAGGIRPLKEPIPLYCDNQSAIEFTQNYNYHARTKHINI
jgi:hypothetical protein